nr:sigma-70 family RNA polymerase sigma factor [bacterium]
MLMELLKWLREMVLMVSHVSGSSFPEPMTPQEEQEALRRLAQGDMEARNRLVECNLRFVAHIARKFSNTGMDMDDLVSVGSIGLIKAVNTYSPNKGTQLATYAARCIENAILS